MVFNILITCVLFLPFTQIMYREFQNNRSKAKMSTTLDTINDGGVNRVEFLYIFSARGTCVLVGSPQKETSVWTKWLQSGCSHLVVCQGPHATSSTNQHFRVYRYGTNINMICIKTQHTQHLLNRPTEIQPPYRLTSDQIFFCALSSEK